MSSSLVDFIGCLGWEDSSAASFMMMIMRCHYRLYRALRHAPKPGRVTQHFTAPPQRSWNQYIIKCTSPLLQPHFGRRYNYHACKNAYFTSQCLNWIYFDYYVAEALNKVNASWSYYGLATHISAFHLRLNISGKDWCWYNDDERESHGYAGLYYNLTCELNDSVIEGSISPAPTTDYCRHAEQLTGTSLRLSAMIFYIWGECLMIAIATQILLHTIKQASQHNLLTPVALLPASIKNALTSASCSPKATI